MAHRARKWGQHWLASDELAEALVALVQPLPEDHFIEIGPGRGRLTEALLRYPVRITAVEIDPECHDHLLSLGYGKRLMVMNVDILAADPMLPWDDGRIRLIGNLPYEISSPVLRWTARRRSNLIDAHYMLQAEVAERIAASPGCRAYGLLSVLMQWEFSVHILKRLSPGAFRPEPRVRSAFIRLTPHAESATGRSAHQVAVLQAAFGHRRKMLASALAMGGWRREVAEQACAKADLDPRARAENLSPQDFLRLGAALPEVEA